MDHVNQQIENPRSVLPGNFTIRVLLSDFAELHATSYPQTQLLLIYIFVF